MNIKQRLSAAVLAFLSLLAPPAQAIDFDGGDYDAAPAGVNLAVLYLQYAARDGLYAGSDKAPGDNRLDSQVGIARAVRYMDVSGFTVAPQFLLPFGRLEAKGDVSALGSDSGLGDLILAAPVWFINNQKEHTFFGITPYLYLPTGSYDRNQALNLGENRYKLTLQAGFSTRVLPQLAWDLGADATFYGDNKDYAGNKTLKQDTGYQLQTNVRYFLTPAFDLRAGLSYQNAGDTKVDGVKADANTQSKFWVGTNIILAPTTQLIVLYGRDIDVENGFKEENRINLRLLQIF